MAGRLWLVIGRAARDRPRDQGGAPGRACIVTYANGDVGYVATEQDFAARGYASSMAFAIHGHFQFQADVGRRLEEAATALLRKQE